MLALGLMADVVDKILSTQQVSPLVPWPLKNAFHDIAFSASQAGFMAMHGNVKGLQHGA